MKQIGFYLLMVILIFNCQSKEKTVEVKKTYPRNDRFIVSENDRWLDSIQNAIAKEGYEKAKITFIGDPDSIHFSMGKFHFMVLDEQNAFVISRASTYVDVVLCGTLVESDVEFKRNQINQYLDSIRPIPLNEIKNYLKANKDEIIAGKEYRDSPVNITFALKRDTLKGPFMYDILNFMEENGMKIYTIRRMNGKELEAVEKFYNK